MTDVQTVRKALGVGDRSVEEVVSNTGLSAARTVAALVQLVESGVVRPERFGYVPTVDANGVPFSQMIKPRPYPQRLTDDLAAFGA